MDFKDFYAGLLFLLTYSTFGQSISPFQINDILFELPGKWEVQGQLKSSGQYHLFSKKQKLSLLISVRKQENFEFYNDSLDNKQTLESFYQWESEYWSAQNGRKAEVEKIFHHLEDNYIIWKLTVKNLEENNSEDVSSILLYTVKDKKLISIGISDNNKKNPRTQDELIKLLKEINP